MRTILAGAATYAAMYAGSFTLSCIFLTITVMCVLHARKVRKFAGPVAVKSARRWITGRL